MAFNRSFARSAAILSAALAAGFAMAGETGRMAGGGVLSCPVRVTHALYLNCGQGPWGHAWPSFTSGNPPKPNIMEVHWRYGKSRYRFHLTELMAANCTGDPTEAGNPRANFNTMEAYGVGTLNGEPATIALILTDEGEPGKNVDQAGYTIADAAGGVVLDCDGRLEGGNQQALKPIRPRSRHDH